MQTDPSKINIIDKLQTSMIVFGVASVLLLYAGSFWLSLTCPFSLTYEGVELWASWALAHGVNIYDPARLSAEPWCVNIYPPLMPLIGQLFSGSARECLLALRVIAILSSVGTGVLLWSIMRRSNCSGIGICGALVFFFSTVPVWFTSIIAKPDFPCIALTMAALWLFWRQFELRETTLAKLLPCLLVSVLALLTKQQGVVAPLTICAFLLVKREVRSALSFGAALLVAYAVVSITFHLITGSTFALYAFLKQLHWDVNNLQQILTSLGWDAAKLALIIVFALWYALRQRIVSDEFHFAAIFLLLSSIQCLSSLGVPAATSNHLIIPFIALTMIAALIGTRWPWFAAVLSVVSVVLVLNLYEFLDGHVKTLKASGIAVLQLLPHRGKLLSEDPYWVWSSGLELVMVDCNIFESVWRLHPELEIPLTDRIKARDYAAIMINARDADAGGGYLWNPSVMKAINGGYKRVADATGHGIKQYIYLPK
jgi:Dolichyl-phosphate-mannose-protein mannosyltransferase